MIAGHCASRRTTTEADLTSSNSPRAVIFDMDGVLVDSYQAHWQSWHFMAQELGKGLTEEQFVSTFGRTSREIIAEHWGENALAPDEIAEFDQRKEALYREIVASNFPAMDGARELLRELHVAGFRLAVGSSGPPENVALAVERLAAAEYFDVLVTGKDVSRGKPDPQVFLVAAKRLGVAPARCAVIEDAPVGIAAANAAGMASVALLSTGHTAESVAAARLVIRSLRELSPDRIAGLIAGRVD
jgi:beta-phosphoglucomutase